MPSTNSQSMNQKQVILAKGRERSLLRFHPWVYSGAVAECIGEPAAGETVDLLSSEGSWLASAAYSPHSQIRLRVWSFDRDENVGPAFFQQRLQRCLDYRRRLGLPAADNDAYRLVHGEADGLPGCIVDNYAGYLSCQFLSAGAEFWKQAIVAALLQTVPGVKGVYERSDTDARGREGLPEATGILAGEPPPDDLSIEDHGLRFLVDVRNGHKTGFYLDQRENRLAVLPLAADADVLDCCCYSGGFALRCLQGNARSVLCLDAAESSLEQVRRQAALNNLADDRLTCLKGDLFLQLRQFRDARRSFDLIILDPPKFADSQQRLEKAARGYKDINLLAIKLLRPGGSLLTFSCSAAMTAELFRKVVGDAARDARRDVLVARAFAQAADHPQALNFPEGHYLTGLQLTVF